MDTDRLQLRQNLLAPGQRFGYLALSPLMPAAELTALREAFFPCQMALGWAYPNAVMQHAVPAGGDAARAGSRGADPRPSASVIAFCGQRL